MARVEKFLVLCVDRDDDVGRKGKIQTPILGRDEVKDAAVKLALADPEEPDANAMFAAIRLHDRLVAEGSECNVALVAGSSAGGLKADRKILRELEQVLERFPADRAILISDGYSDEAIIPVIQSRIPIASIKRVVVKHSRLIEESVAVFSRYLDTLVSEPRYARIALGIPGLLMILLAILWSLGLLHYTGLVALIVLGSSLAIKGFGIDRLLWRAWQALKAPPYEGLRLYTAIAACIICAVAVYRGASLTIPLYPEAPVPYLVGQFLESSIALFVIGSGLFLIGSSIRHYLARDAGLWRTIAGVALSIVSYPIVLEVATILKEPAKPATFLAYWVGVGTIIMFAVVTLTYTMSLKFSGYFHRGGEEG